MEQARVAAPCGRRRLGGGTAEGAFGQQARSAAQT